MFCLTRIFNETGGGIYVSVEKFVDSLDTINGKEVKQHVLAVGAKVCIRSPSEESQVVWEVTKWVAKDVNVPVPWTGDHYNNARKIAEIAGLKYRKTTQAFTNVIVICATGSQGDFLSDASTVNEFCAKICDAATPVHRNVVDAARVKFGEDSDDFAQVRHLVCNPISKQARSQLMAKHHQNDLTAPALLQKLGCACAHHTDPDVVCPLCMADNFLSRSTCTGFDKHTHTPKAFFENAACPECRKLPGRKFQEDHAIPSKRLRLDSTSQCIKSGVALIAHMNDYCGPDDNARECMLGVFKGMIKGGETFLNVKTIVYQMEDTAKTTPTSDKSHTNGGGGGGGGSGGGGASVGSSSSSGAMEIDTQGIPPPPAVPPPPPPVQNPRLTMIISPSTNTSAHILAHSLGEVPDAFDYLRKHFSGGNKPGVFALKCGVPTLDAHGKFVWPTLPAGSDVPTECTCKGLKPYVTYTSAPRANEADIHMVNYDALCALTEQVIPALSPDMTPSDKLLLVRELVIECMRGRKGTPGLDGKTYIAAIFTAFAQLHQQRTVFPLLQVRKPKRRQQSKTLSTAAAFSGWTHCPAELLAYLRSKGVTYLSPNTVELIEGANLCNSAVFWEYIWHGDKAPASPPSDPEPIMAARVRKAKNDFIDKIDTAEWSSLRQAAPPQQQQDEQQVQTQKEPADEVIPAANIVAAAMSTQQPQHGPLTLAQAELSTFLVGPHMTEMKTLMGKGDQHLSLCGRQLTITPQHERSAALALVATFLADAISGRTTINPVIDEHAQTVIVDVKGCTSKFSFSSVLKVSAASENLDTLSWPVSSPHDAAEQFTSLMAEDVKAEWQTYDQSSRMGRVDQTLGGTSSEDTFIARLTLALQHPTYEWGDEEFESAAFTLNRCINIYDVRDNATKLYGMQNGFSHLGFLSLATFECNGARLTLSSQAKPEFGAVVFLENLHGQAAAADSEEEQNVNSTSAIFVTAGSETSVPNQCSGCHNNPTRTVSTALGDVKICCGNVLHIRRAQHILMPTATASMGRPMFTDSGKTVSARDLPTVLGCVYNGGQIQDAAALDLVESVFKSFDICGAGWTLPLPMVTTATAAPTGMQSTNGTEYRCGTGGKPDGTLAVLSESKRRLYFKNAASFFQQNFVSEEARFAIENNPIVVAAYYKSAASHLDWASFKIPMGVASALTFNCPTKESAAECGYISFMTAGKEIRIGTGSVLLYSIVTILKARGIDTVFVAAVEESVTFFQKAGFKITNTPGLTCLPALAGGIFRTPTTRLMKAVVSDILGAVTQHIGDEAFPVKKRGSGRSRVQAREHLVRTFTKITEEVSPE